jgi:hypothetical protein
MTHLWIRSVSVTDLIHGESTTPSVEAGILLLRPGYSQNDLVLTAPGALYLCRFHNLEFFDSTREQLVIGAPYSWITLEAETSGRLNRSQVARYTHWPHSGFHLGFTRSSGTSWVFELSIPFFAIDLAIAACGLSAWLLLKRNASRRNVTTVPAPEK